MSYELGKKISDLSGYGSMVLAQALIELEQSNLSAGTRSRKIALDDFQTEVVKAWFDVNYPSDSAWTTTTSLSNGWTGTVRYIRRAGIVTVVIEAIDGSAKTDNGFLTLPAGYRPAVVIRGALHTDAGGHDSLVVAAGGGISSNGAAADLRGSVTYPVIT